MELNRAANLENQASQTGNNLLSQNLMRQATNAAANAETH